MQKIKKMNNWGFTHVLLAMGFMATFAIIGVAYLVISHAAAGSNYLEDGETLYVGQSLNSGNGYTLDMQGDGNLVIYNPSGAPTWASNTVGTGNNDRLIMQGDGNLVLYNASGGAVWSSGTYGYGASALFMQTDGNLVVYKDANGQNGGGSPTWASQSNSVLEYRSGFSTIPASVTSGATCMSVAGNSTANGALMQEWGCTGSAGQNYEFRSVPSLGYAGLFEIVNQLSNQCLDISNGNTANGVRVQQWGCSHVAQQLWRVQPSARSGYYQIINHATGKCIDITAGGTSNGTGIQQWDCLSNVNQQWAGSSVANAYTYATPGYGPVGSTSPPSGGGTGSGTGGTGVTPFPPLSGNSAAGQMVGCTVAAQNGCSGQWFYRTGSVNAAWGGMPSGYGAIWGISDLNTNAPIGVYIGDQVDVHCPSSSGVQCQKNILSYYRNHGAPVVYVAYTDPNGCGANPGSNPFASLGGTELYEWYYSTTGWYCGTNTSVKAGASGYLVNRFFQGTNPYRAPVVTGTSISAWPRIWNNAANASGNNKPIMYW